MAKGYSQRPTPMKVREKPAPPVDALHRQMLGALPGAPDQRYSRPMPPRTPTALRPRRKR